MNPGDIYNPRSPPPSGQQQQQQQQQHPLHSSQSQPNIRPGQTFPTSSTFPQPALPGQLPYGASPSGLGAQQQHPSYSGPGHLSPPPNQGMQQQQQQARHSQSMSYGGYGGPTSPTRGPGAGPGPRGRSSFDGQGGGGVYGDPFQPQPPPAPQAGYNSPSRPFPHSTSASNVGGGGGGGGYSLADPPARPITGMAGGPPPDYLNPNLNVPGGYPAQSAYTPPLGLTDNRLMSPPPLVQSYSSSSLGPLGPGQNPNALQQGNGNAFGARRSSYGQTHSDGGHDPDAADDADRPLLAHASPGPGLRFSANQRGYELQDGPGGDLGGGAGAYGNGYANGNANGYGGYDNGYNGMDDDGSTVGPRYGPIPNRVVRRNRTQKRVALFRGHLVLDVPVPSMLLDQVPYKEGNEFTKMRYTAVTCDPDMFVEDKYTLRQRLYDPPRQTELFIVITMYNEDDVLFCRTMRGVMQNIAHLCTRDRSKTWGKEGWKKVVVCIVADGRLKINARTRSVLAALGVYQDGVAKNVVNGRPVTAHLYEYTTQLMITSDGKIKGGDSRAVPVQLMFCLKEKNQKKINSHRWFFNAFGQCLKPNVCVLLDVGTQPGHDSIYHLWKAFDINSSVGGACGEIVALKGQFWRNLINPLVAAQNFEYKMSNILDKPLESIFGYITVLPGAFSAYRYIALLNDEKGNGPLKQYFLGEKMHGAGAGIFEANMYLAEDRILCWELVSKRACKWKLHYVKSAYAITDVPDAVPELVSQRRRWLNGSFFAAIHSIVHFGYLYRSSHTFTRKFFLHIEFLYQLIQLIFSWFALGNFYIAFVVLTNSLDTLGSWWHYVNLPLQYIYIALLVWCFILSLGNRPAGSKWGYMISMFGFAILTVYMAFAAVYLAVVGIRNVEDQFHEGDPTVSSVFGNKIFRNIVLSLAATYGLYIIASVLAFDPWHMLTSFLQYMLLAPSYVNVMNVYAFCNVHDVSWGTKGSDKVRDDLGVVKSHSDNKNEVTVEVPEEQKDINANYAAELKILSTKAPPEVKAVNEDQKQEDYYRNFRTNVLLFWVLCNAGLAAGILQTSGGSSSLATTYMGILLYTVAGLAFFRFVGSTAYLIVRIFVGE